MKIIKTLGFIKISAKKKKNPWAICHTTVDKKKDPEKYEKCVMDVKKKTKNAQTMPSVQTRPVNFVQEKTDVLPQLINQLGNSFFDGIGDYLVQVEEILQKYGYTINVSGLQIVDKDEGEESIEVKKVADQSYYKDLYISWVKMGNERFEVEGQLV